MPVETLVDVLVIGGGNAALCAALCAREAGASVMLLEAAPRARRGGTSGRSPDSAAATNASPVSRAPVRARAYRRA